ncbi:MAG TPA: hypothetical protein VFE12_17915 [Acetobacteraceae bacterium]|nr:hypothetical protein [Acetobacteraceae bacterium]
MPLAQSALVAHVVAHLLVAVSQLYGTQIVAGPDLQRPSPSQTFTSLTEAPSQVPGSQTVPAGYFRQWPWPSQVPSWPQVAAAEEAHWPAGAWPPFATNEQIPGALGSLQVLHVSVQALLQQTPSTQNALWQSPAQPQAAPFGRFAPPSTAAQAASMVPLSGFDPPCPPPQAASPRSSGTQAAKR